MVFYLTIWNFELLFNKEVKMRKISRISKEKFFDTKADKNITLDDIAKIIRKGEKVKIIDKKTGKDITANILADVIAKDKTRVEPVILNMAKDVIKGTEEFFESIFKGQKKSSLLKRTKENMEKIVDTLVDEGKIARKEAGKLSEELFNTLKKSRDKFSKKMGDLISELKEKSSGKDDIEKIKKRVDTLEVKVNKIIENMK